MATYPSHSRRIQHENLGTGGKSLRSSSGQYFAKLDQVRAFACYCVFMWHFFQGTSGSEYSPALFPFALLKEGHVGVSFFMCLSGYLFAKILDGAEINYVAFLWNRFLRLAPLLVFVLAIVGTMEVAFNGRTALSYTKFAITGLIFPIWPNGGWSIAVEAHFYLLLPMLLLLAARSQWLILSLVAFTVSLRVGLHLTTGNVQVFAYHTILGRFDQFAFGLLFFHVGKELADKHALALLTAAGFLAFYYAFDRAGGWPAADKRLWIVIPTIEAFCISLLIAYYDRTQFELPQALSHFLAKIGEASYSIYLLHPFFVSKLSAFAAGLSFFPAVIIGTIVFVATLPISLVTYNLIEKPIMSLRIKYTRKPKRPSFVTPRGTTIVLFANVT
jgi:peptidoglycan/LPS O-acetylase OafA/YrhL